MLGYPRLGVGCIPARLGLLLVLERVLVAPSPLLRGCHPGGRRKGPFVLFEVLVAFLAARLGVRQCDGYRVVFLQNGAQVILVFILCRDRPSGENVSGEQL